MSVRLFSPHSTIGDVTHAGHARPHKHQYKNKGAVKLFGICVLSNKEFVPEGQGGEGERRMMARNRALPVYCMEEFNYKARKSRSI